LNVHLIDLLWISMLAAENNNVIRSLFDIPPFFAKSGHRCLLP
jgi:hypothetical protein